MESPKLWSWTGADWMCNTNGRGKAVVIFETFVAKYRGGRPDSPTSEYAYSSARFREGWIVLKNPLSNLTRLGKDLRT